MTKRAIRLGAIGLFLWLAAQFVALLLAGAGHGWVAPLRISIALLPLYPLVMVRAFSPPGSRMTDGLILAAAVALDAFLIDNMLFREREYLVGMWELGAWAICLWIALWLGWQALAAAAFLKPR